jgi:hypothetical protein
MTADRIDTRDAYGEVFELVRGAELLAIESQAEKRRAVTGILVHGTGFLALTEDGAVQVASFLGHSRLARGVPGPAGGARAAGVLG